MIYTLNSVLSQTNRRKNYIVRIFTSVMKKLFEANMFDEYLELANACRLNSQKFEEKQMMKCCKVITTHHCAIFSCHGLKKNVGVIKYFKLWFVCYNYIVFDLHWFWINRANVSETIKNYAVLKIKIAALIKFSP